MENEGPNDLYGFRQDDNFYYLSGLTEPGAALLIASAAEAKGDAPARSYTEILFLPPRNLTQEKWTGPKLGAENPEAPKITGFDRVEDMGSFPRRLMKVMSGARVLWFTPTFLARRDFASGRTAGVSEAMLNSYLSFQDVKPMISSLRTTKDAGEMALMPQGGRRLGGRALCRIQSGEAECERARNLRAHAIRVGQARLRAVAYAPIVGSGYYSTVLHYSDDDNVMKSGDVVVIDAAGEYSMYASDITRTLAGQRPLHRAPARDLRHCSGRATGRCGAAFKSGKSNDEARRSRLALQGRTELHQHSRQRPARRAAGEILSSTVWAIRLG
jgi:Xaa-Pro aminopeptidase